MDPAVRPVVGSLRLPPAVWASLREYGTAWIVAAVEREQKRRAKAVTPPP